MKIAPNVTGLIVLGILGCLAGIFGALGQWEIVKAVLAMMGGQLLATPYSVHSEPVPETISVQDERGVKHDT